MTAWDRVTLNLSIPRDRLACHATDRGTYQYNDRQWLLRVIRAILTVHRSLPVYPDKQPAVIVHVACAITLKAISCNGSSPIFSMKRNRWRLNGAQSRPS